MKGPAETKKADSSQIGEVLHLTSSSRHSRNPSESEGSIAFKRSALDVAFVS